MKKLITLISGIIILASCEKELDSNHTPGTFFGASTLSLNTKNHGGLFISSDSVFVQITDSSGYFLIEHQSNPPVKFKIPIENDSHFHELKNANEDGYIAHDDDGTDMTMKYLYTSATDTIRLTFMGDKID